MVAVTNIDLFDSGCEILVIPISTVASYSFPFESGLLHKKIKASPKKNKYELGEIEVHSIRGNLTTKYIVFACSVKDGESNYLIVGEIGIKLARLVQSKKQINSIGVPLLGTGAGKLQYSSSLNSLFSSFYKQSRPNVDLNFCIPDFDTFKKLKEEYFSKVGTSLLRVRQLIIDCLRTRVKTLDLGNYGLSTIGNLPELFECTHLEALILSNEWGEYEFNHWVRKKSKNKGPRNILSELPSSLSNLRNLRELICGGDWKTSTLSGELQWSIKSIENITGLKNLRILNVSNNQISDLKDLDSFKYLQKIYLNNNIISSVPNLSNQTDLTELFLSNNKITNVEFLREARSIKTLDLHSNLISDLRPIRNLIAKVGIKDAKWTMKTIGIASNPLVIPKLDLIEQGAGKVVAYIDRYESEQVLRLNGHINRDIKLILVGNSNVGKTTLAYWLRNRQIKKDMPTTHWLVTDKWEIKSQGKDYTIRIFDFGGQEYYHDTHYLFFTSNTVYIVFWEEKTNVFDEIEIEQGEKNGVHNKIKLQTFPLEFWLDSIIYHTKKRNKTKDEIDAAEISANHSLTTERSNSANEKLPSTILNNKNILIVQNKVDSIIHKGFIDQKSISNLYPQIQDFLNISVWCNKGLLELEEALFQVFDSNPMTGKEMLGTWGMIKNEIETKEFNTSMSLFEFRNYCNIIIKKIPAFKNKSKSFANKYLFNNQDAQSFAQYLNNVGILLYFPENPELNDKIFINQKRILKNIYDLLQEIDPSNGQFDLNKVIRKLGKSIPNEEISDTVKLMINFKIIFEHPANNAIYIAPLYLPKKPTDSIRLFLPLFNKPTYRYEYQKFSKDIILSFFSLYGSKALRETGDSEKYYYWREGIILRDDNTGEIIMIKFHPATKQVPCAYVDVYKINDSINETFLKQIINDLDILNQEWEGIKTVSLDGKEFIPLSKIHQHEANNNWLFEHNNKVHQLTGFKKYLKQQLKMKKVFISYSKKDLAHLNKLENHLSVLKRNGTIGVWNCRQLLPGEKWDGKIKKELEEADLILFLVSDDFLATDYIWDIEIKRAIERESNNDQVTVVPIIIRACDWEASPLGVFNTAPKKAEVINSAVDIDEAWTRVVKELKKVL